ncbi:uncharacterized protein METZ01_LOCUS257748 [marine metagenome]|uniref:O-methyltransferase domain-containing protein n=1 Tax=marine metagenome TaxID=408172 RepID=A0A382IYH5_9ZZZZ
MLSYKNIIKKIEQLEEANILISALEFNIFSVLKNKPLSSRQIASITKTNFEATELLLNALAAMGALYKIKNHYKNTPVTYKYFCKASPDFKKGTVMLKADGRGEFEKLSKVIQKGRDIKEFEGEDDPKFRRLFTFAMHERSQLYAKKLANIVTKKKVGKLIDLGCGPGSYSVEILKKDKTATATLMDRATALKVGCELYKNQAVYKRLKFVCCDLFNDEFGEGYDTVLLSNVLHIYSHRENKSLFKKINKALISGGRFIIFDLFLKDSKIEPYDAALFAITMILYTKTGKSYSFGEIDSLLKKEGFTRLKKINIGYGSSVIEARKV